MMKSFAALLAAAAAAAATASAANPHTHTSVTHVAIVEFGAKGMVHRTAEYDEYSSAESSPSAASVSGLWRALHSNHNNKNKKQQQQQQQQSKLFDFGQVLPVVPDLFQRPDLGLVVGVTSSHPASVDVVPKNLLQHMPNVAALFQKDSAKAATATAVASWDMSGSQWRALAKTFSATKPIVVVVADEEEEENHYDDLRTASQKALLQRNDNAKGGGVAVVERTCATLEAAQSVDQHVAQMLQDLQTLAESSGKTILLHLVMEEDVEVTDEDVAQAAAAAMARRSRRRLEDAANDNNNGGENAAQNADDAVNNGQQNSVYYGYRYYNSNGELVTPYKSMFQIQYFNVVLWTALGLVAALIFTVYLMLYMPLEPDTLLFGESAKMVGSE